MKRSRIQLYLLGLLLGGGLAGCTGSLVEEVVPEEAQPVELSFGRPDLGIPVVTRAAGEATPLPTGSTIRIAAYRLGDIGYGAAPADFGKEAPFAEATYVVGDNGSLSPCQVDANGKWVAAAARGLAVRSGIYDFYAVSPARTLTNTEDRWKVTGIPHKEDVMTSFARDVSIVKGEAAVTLNSFRRKCALSVFTVYPSEKNIVPINSLFATSLKLTELSSSGAELVIGATSLIAKTGGDATDKGQVLFDAEEFVAVAEESDPDKLGLNKCIGVVLPKNGTAFNVEVIVSRDGIPITLKGRIDKNISFEEGKRYVFTLEVENDMSRLVMRVIPWNLVTFCDEEVGGPVGGVRPSDPDIFQGTGIGITIAEWCNIDWSGAMGGKEI